MKTSKILIATLLGLTSIIMTVNGICADVLIDESPQTYQCGTPGIFTNSSFPQLPAGGKVLAVTGELKIDSYCPPTNSPYRFAVVTLDHPTVLGTKIKLFDIYWDTISNRLTLASQDSNGLTAAYYLTMGGGALPNSSFWYSFTAWVDITGNVAKAFFGLPGLVTQSSTSLSTRNYPSTWTVDMNPTLYLCSDDNGGSSLGCQVANLKTFYQVPAWNIQLKEGSFGTLFARYNFNQSSGWAVSDSVGSLGPALLGSSTETTEDPVVENKPVWIPPIINPLTSPLTQDVGLNFTNASQYVTIPTFPIAMGFQSPSYSITFKFWLKLTEYPPTGTRYIFRYATSDLSANIFGLSIQFGGTLQFNYYNKSHSYTASKQLNKGYWNSIVMSYSFRPYASDGTKYYGTLSALVNNQEDLSTEINPTAEMPGLFDPTNIVRIGGPPSFSGAISGFEIYNPGSTLISGSSCNPSVCSRDIGLSNPAVCVLPKCHTSCSTCIDSLDTNCLSCAYGRIFYQGKCIVRDCGLGRYFDAADYTCKDCISGCGVCTGPTPAECTTCRSGFWKSNGVCECVTGTYLPENSTTCATCASKTTNCYQCTQNGTCTRCYNNYLLIYGECVLTSTCPARMYKSLYACIDCTSNCAVCNSLGCTTCDPGFFMYNKQCYATCPSGTYQYSSTTCATCTKSNCAQCTSTTCQLCAAGYMLYNGNCVNSCPAGTYSNGTACVACSSVAANCNQCNSTACLTCNTNYLRYNGQCVASCPAGTTQSETECITCTANCAQCTSSECQLCAASYLLSNGQCVSSCPSGFYSTGTACVSCSSVASNCAQCDSSECLVCDAGYLVYNGECVAACPTGTYSMCAAIGF